MKTIRSIIDSVFSRIKHERFNTTINTRFAVLNVIAFYTIILTMFQGINNLEFLLTFISLSIFAFINYRAKSHYYLFTNDLILYVFYFIELTILTASIQFLSSYTVFYFHPMMGLFYASILISGFHGKKEVVVFTTAVSTILKSFLFFTNVKFFGYEKNLNDESNHKFIYLLDYVFAMAVNIIFGWLVFILVKTFQSAQAIISKVTFREVLDSAFKGLTFSNESETFFDKKLKITSTLFQSSDLGGGDFICIEKKDDFIYGIIGDISSHGTDMISGSYIASLTFKNFIHYADKPKTFQVLKTISATLHNLDEHQGGKGVAICFRISRTGDFFYSGFLYKTCMKINGIVTPLSRPYSLGEKKEYKIARENYASIKGSTVEISTDGWNGSGDDDRARLLIEWK